MHVKMRLLEVCTIKYPKTLYFFRVAKYLCLVGVVVNVIHVCHFVKLYTFFATQRPVDIFANNEKLPDNTENKW